jgi:hypothetical protein
VSGLLEREREEARITALLAAAKHGNGSSLHVEGSAGIGKTSLLGMTVEVARAVGYAVLTASGGELEVEFPYGVVRQLFLPVLERPDTSSLLSGVAAPAKAVLSRSRVSRVARTSSSGAFEVLDALFWLTANLSATQPLIFVVDDTHWCDGHPPLSVVCEPPPGRPTCRAGQRTASRRARKRRIAPSTPRYGGKPRRLAS